MLRRQFGASYAKNRNLWDKTAWPGVPEFACRPAYFYKIKLLPTRWAEYVERMGKDRRAHWVLEGMRPLERTRCRWKINIKINVYK